MSKDEQPARGERSVPIQNHPRTTSGPVTSTRSLRHEHADAIATGIQQF